MSIEVCGTLFTRSDFKDASGCLKPYAHNNAHICQTESGKYVEWEDDYSCTCGCWDDDLNNVCKVYHTLSETEFNNYQSSLK